MPARKTPRRLDLLTVYYVVARRYNIKDVFARAERLRAKLGVGRALMCTCAMSEQAKSMHKQLLSDANGPRRYFRTRFR